MHALTIATGWVGTERLPGLHDRPWEAAPADRSPRSLAGTSRRRQGRARLRRRIPGGSRAGRRPCPAREGGGAAGGSSSTPQARAPPRTTPPRGLASPGGCGRLGTAAQGGAPKHGLSSPSRTSPGLTCFSRETSTVLTPVMSKFRRFSSDLRSMTRRSVIFLPSA